LKKWQVKEMPILLNAITGTRDSKSFQIYSINL